MYFYVLSCCYHTYHRGGGLTCCDIWMLPQYKLTYKFQEWNNDAEHNAYGIPSDSSKFYKWFLVKYQAENLRWYFVKANEVTFVYNFLLQEVKVRISFDTWLFMPAGLVRGIDQGHWICS